MADTVVGVVRVDAEVSTAGVQAGVSDAQKKLAGFGQSLTSLGAGITKTGMVMSAGLTAPFLALVKVSMTAAKESRIAIGQVEAAQKSMGNASRLTTEQLKEQATALMGMSTFDDDDILTKVTANLLTFGNVADEQFKRAQQAAVDMSSRMGTDLQSSAMMLGKALNDPAKGIAKLGKAGIQFSAEQKTMIESMTAAGNVAGAQGIMLDELAKQFGGAGQAMQDASPGDDVKDQWATLQETVGDLALNILPKLTGPLNSMLAGFNALPGPVQATAVTVAAVGAALGPIMLGIGPLVGMLGTMVTGLAGAGTAMGAAGAAAGGFLPLLAPLLPIIAGVAAAAALAYAAWANWGEVGPILEKLGADVMAVLGPELMATLDTLKSSLTTLWQGPFGDLLKGAGAIVSQVGTIIFKMLGETIPAAIGVLGAAFRGVIGVVTGVITAVSGVLTGDWAAVWNGAKMIVTSVVKAVLGVIESLFPGATAALAKLYAGVKTWLGDKLGGIFTGVIDKVRAVGQAFYKLMDDVVGHSYVPDMVDGIQAVMARLDGVMVDPAKKATKKTGEAFKAMADQVGGLLDRLFPEAAASRAYAADLALIDKALAKNILTTDQAAEARKRLALEGVETETITIIGGSNDPIEQLGGKSLDDLIREMPLLAETAESTTSKVITSFADMALGVVDSMQGMVASFKSKDWLGVLTGVLNIVGQVASAFGKGGSLTGLFGGSTPAPGGKPPGFATGGSFRVGGAPGTDSNLVQFRATKGEMVNITRPGDAGSSQPYFDLRGAVMTSDLVAQMNHIGDTAAMRGAAGGAAMAQQRFAKRGRHHLGG